MQKLNLTPSFWERKETIEDFGRSYFLYPGEANLCRRWFSAGGRILDLGCGTGRTTLILHEAQLNVIGIDLSIGMVSRMKRRFPYLQSMAADATALPFADASFDGVLFSYNGLSFIYPMERRKAALSEIHRVLKTGGHFIFSAHNAPGIVFNLRDRSLRTLSERFFTLPRMFRTGYVYEQKIASTVYYGTVDQTIQELQDAGFSWVETTDRNGRFGRAIASWIDPWPYHCFRRGEWQ